MTERHGLASAPRPRIVVVGPCASGKTTLVAGLRSLGHDVAACGQEHSDIPTLWRHTNPDVLIALVVDLPTVRRRRGADWPEALFRTQQRRLAPAIAAAHLVLDTAHLDPGAALDQAARVLASAQPSPPDS